MGSKIAREGFIEKVTFKLRIEESEDKWGENSPDTASGKALRHV